MVVNRVGVFLTFIALVLMMLFIFSWTARTPNFVYFLASAALLTAGILLVRRNPAPPPPPSGRFSLMKPRKRGKKGSRSDSDEEEE